MRLLHLSDLHFGKNLYEYSLLPDQRHWCGQLLEYLDRVPHDGVLIAGDLYDRSVPSGDAVDLCDWFLGELAGERRLPVLCIAGNHDSPQRLGFGSRLYRAGGLYMAARPQRRLERVTLRDQWGEVDFFLLPYLSPGDARTLFPDREIRTFDDAFGAVLEENQEELERCPRRVLLAHGFFARGGDPEHSGLVTCDSEIQVGGLDLIDAGRLAGFSYCALGHLHSCQEAGSPRARYCGSPLKYSVSEEHQEKCVLSVTLDGGGEVSVERVSFPPLREVRSVRGTMEELLAPTGGTLASEDYVQITLLTQGTEVGAAQRLRNVYPNYLQIRYQNPAQRRLELEGHGELARMSLGEAYRKFYLQVTGHPLEPEPGRILDKLAREAGEGRDEP